MGRTDRRLGLLLLNVIWLPLAWADLAAAADAPRPPTPPPAAEQPNTAAPAADPPQSERLAVTDGWLNGARLLHLPDWLSFSFSWTAEPFMNPVGGVRELSNWVQQSSLSLAASSGLAKPTPQWREVDHWSVNLDVTHNAGDPSYASTIGALFPLQQVAYPTGFLLSELSLSRSSGSGWLQFKGGIMPINPPFITAPIFNSYVHSAFNNTLNLSLVNRFSPSTVTLPISPYAALGGSLSLQAAPDLNLRYGWFDLGSTSSIAGWLGGATLPPLGGGGGAQLLQLDWSPAALGPPSGADLQACRSGSGVQRRGLSCSRPVQVSSQMPPGLISLGGISSSNLGEAAYASLTLRSGVPLGLDERVWIGGSWSRTAEQNPGPSFVGGGWLIQGLLPSRPLDLLVFGAGRANGLGSGYEGVIELGYQWQVNSNVNLQPTLQWIIHPNGATPAPPGILAAGLQISVNF